MSRTHPSCNFKTWFDWLDTPSSCGHKTLYAICRRWHSWRSYILFRLRLGLFFFRASDYNT